MSHAPQYGQTRKKRTKQGRNPAKALPPLVIPVEPGQANCDLIRLPSSGFVRLNTGFWRGIGRGLRATASPVETLAVEPYRGAKRARGQATAGQQAHGIFTPALDLKITMHLWHKSARRKGALVPSLQGPVISKR